MDRLNGSSGSSPEKDSTSEIIGIKISCVNKMDKTLQEFKTS